jgi:hypothetical protein
MHQEAGLMIRDLIDHDPRDIITVEHSKFEEKII